MPPSRIRSRGFTLVEILVALVVVGVLASVVVVGVSTLTGTSGSAACTGSRDAAAAGAIAHYTNTGQFPATFADMTGATPPELNLPSSATVDATGLIATTSNWTLTLTPGATGVAPTFTCGAGTNGIAAPATSAAATTSAASTTPATSSTSTTSTTSTTTTSTPVVGGSPTSAAPTTAAATTTPATTTAATTTTAAPTTTTVAANGTAACPGTFTGWVAEYYSNQSLTGSPAFCRDDASIAFNWGSGTAKSGYPGDHFSVRWTKVVNFSNGNHVFTMGSDDGSRLYIDGTKVLDMWRDQSYATSNVTRSLSGAHVVVMEFYENGGLANATLTWT